ncbi:MAG: hypothetical protein E7029_06175 [Planctomycetaceae bacterium]|nr:hypothetical protein [Planctomycetaceae bacterium]
MAKFSKEMTGLCAQMLKFLNPHLEKSADPDFVMPPAALDELERRLKEIVGLYMKSSADVKSEFRSIADDVDGLYRLSELLQQYRGGLIKISMKTTLSDVQKRTAGIKVMLNRKLGAAPSGNFSKILILLVLIGAAAAWFFLKEPISSLVNSFLPDKPAEVQPADPDTETETAEDADSADSESTEDDADEAEDADGEKEADADEKDAEEAEDAVKPEKETDGAADAKDAESETDAEEAEEPAKKPTKKPSKVTKKPKTYPIRSWTDENGNKVKGRFLRVEPSNSEESQDVVFIDVVSEKGKTAEKGYLFGKFSKKDQAYIRKQME